MLDSSFGPYTCMVIRRCFKLHYGTRCFKRDYVVRNVYSTDLVQYSVPARKCGTIRCIGQLFVFEIPRENGNDMRVGEIAGNICTGNSCATVPRLPH